MNVTHLIDAIQAAKQKYPPLHAGSDNELTEQQRQENEQQRKARIDYWHELLTAAKP